MTGAKKLRQYSIMTNICYVCLCCVNSAVDGAVGRISGRSKILFRVSRNSVKADILIPSPSSSPICCASLQVCNVCSADAAGAKLLGLLDLAASIFGNIIER